MAGYYGFDGEQDQFGISSGSVANSSCFLSSRLTEAGSGGGRSRQRHFYTETQLQLLDAEFSAEMFPSRDRRRRIASQLGVTEKSVLWWFQNRRRRVRQQSKMVVNANSPGPSRNGRRQQRRLSPYHSTSNQSHDALFDNWSVHNGPTWSCPAISQVNNSVDVISSPEVEQQPVDYSNLHQLSSDFQFDGGNQYPAVPVPDTSNWNEWQFQQQLDSGIAVPVSNSNDWNGWQYSIPFYPCHNNQQPLYDYSPSGDNSECFPVNIDNTYEWSQQNGYFS